MPHKSLLAALGGVAVGCIVALLLGNTLHHAYPAMPDVALALIAVGSWVLIAFGIFFAVVGPLPLVQPLPPGLDREGPAHPALTKEEIAARAKRREQMKQESERRAAAFREAKRVRIAELAADPDKSKYIPLMERDWWTDEQIAYHENPSATATCEHLQIVERAMRSAGIVPRLLTRSWDDNFAPLHNVRVDCCLNEPELRCRYQLAETIQFVTGYQPERYTYDNPWADLRCTACGSTIVLVHPDDRRPTTAWFPVPPAN